MATEPEHVLILGQWQYDWIKGELGREPNEADFPPFGWWDRIEIAEPVT
jgi:hypothetical protein